MNVIKIYLMIAAVTALLWSLIAYALGLPAGWSVAVFGAAFVLSFLALSFAGGAGCGEERK